MITKKSVLFMLISLLMISQIFSLEITLSKENYNPRETLQSEITGNFISLRADNIQIYEKGIPRPTPTIKDLTRQGDKYYFYSTLPNSEGNYTFVIENTEYISSGEIVSTPIIKNFTIRKSNETYLIINPGFIIAKDNFKIKIISPTRNQMIIATLVATNQSKSINLIEEEEATLDFFVNGISNNKTYLNIFNYKIPIFITGTTVPVITEGISFDPPEITATVNKNQNNNFKILITNNGQTNIANISLTSNLNATLTPNMISIKSKGTALVNVSVLIPNSDNNITGEINAYYGLKKETLNLFFYISNNTQTNSTNNTINNTTPNLSCVGRGKLCIIPEKCNSDTIATLEGSCCIGDCIIEKKADYSWITGAVILVILTAIIFFVVYRARKKPKMKTSEQILEEKTKKFDERMNPKAPPNKEVNGKIGRI